MLSKLYPNLVLGFLVNLVDIRPLQSVAFITVGAVIAGCGFQRFPSVSRRISR
jgi:hypothetical protein